MVDTFTLTGQLLRHDDTPYARRRFVIYAYPFLTVDTDGNTVHLGSIRGVTDENGYILDADGTAGVELVTAPGQYYRFRLVGEGGMESTTFEAPADGVTIDLSDVTEPEVFPPPSSTEVSVVLAALAEVQAAVDADDTLMTTVAGDADSDFRGAMNGVFARRNYVDAEAYKTGANTDLQAIQAACAAATAITRGAVVRLSSRTWDVGNGLSMSGYSCGLVGMGVSHTGGGAAVPAGTVLHATSQSGAVLDLTGWTVPGSFRGKVEFGKFGLRGSGVADATKAKVGLRNATTAISSVHIHDIVISQTGGPCVDLFDLYLSEVERVVAVNPVSAKANDVPYMIFRGCNGNRFYGLGFRSMDASADTGVSGALIFTDDPGGNVCSTNEVIAPWFEFLHTPTNGTLISLAAKATRISGPYFVDCAKESGATGTSCITILTPSVDQGGNEITGMIPGAQTGVVDTGVKVSQSRNRIVGVKGFNGGNVTLDSGVEFTYVQLGGSVSGTGTSSAFTDNSGMTTNTLLDYARYPNAGAVSNVVLRAAKTADTTRNNTSSATDDPDLTVAVQPGTYLVDGYIAYTSSTTADFKFNLTLPASSTIAWTPDCPTGGSSGTTVQVVRSVLTSSGSNASAGGIGSAVAAYPRGRVVITVAGNVKIQWAQLAAEVSDTIVHAGSWLRLSRVS